MQFRRDLADCFLIAGGLYSVATQHTQWSPRVLGPPQLGVVADRNTTLGRLTFLLPRAEKDVITNIYQRSSSSLGRGALPREIPLPHSGGGSTLWLAELRE